MRVDSAWITLIRTSFQLDLGWYEKFSCMPYPIKNFMCQKNEEKKIKIFLIIKFINSNSSQTQSEFKFFSNSFKTHLPFLQISSYSCKATRWAKYLRKLIFSKVILSYYFLWICYIVFKKNIVNFTITFIIIFYYPSLYPNIIFRVNKLWWNSNKYNFHNLSTWHPTYVIKKSEHTPRESNNMIKYFYINNYHFF